MDSRNTQFFLVFAAIMLLFELVFYNNQASWMEVIMVVGITSFVATVLKSWLEKKFGKKAKNNSSSN